eukprot:TRINITY_DN6049_c0_g2_i1.p2 TRINITY_DN6049_c0_g2~~TRINITY_DN6049_c0_g2_i1.p2  ORF type:complete len:130 (+),score=22.95 TRINITY_DN6049_c0_g2_i1:411-800(+)
MLLRVDGNVTLDARPIMVVMAHAANHNHVGMKLAHYVTPRITYSADAESLIARMPKADRKRYEELTAAPKPRQAPAGKHMEAGLGYPVNTAMALTAGQCMEHQTEDMGEVSIFHRACIHRGFCAPPGGK